MKTNRKEFLKMMGLGMASTSVAGLPVFDNKGKSKKHVLRIAHMTDTHVEPGKAAETGMAKAFAAVNDLAQKPDLIFNGGDCIMDALGRSKEDVKKQWDVWNSILKNENDIQMVNCIGNHDVWAWGKGGDKYTVDSMYGKEWAKDELQLNERYYSFDQAGWHFIILDSPYHVEGGYTAKLDEAQFDWLERDLAAVDSKTPVCVLSHIPIISFTPFFDGDNEKSGNWKVPGAWMHIDARKIKDLFYKHKNVKLALSGHIHLADRVDYLGTTYLCNGAVSGAWWGGDCQEFPPAYALIDLYDDGSFDHQLLPYEWK